MKKYEPCKHHPTQPIRIAYDPKNCWVCDYFNYWKEYEHKYKKWWEFWK